MNPLRERNAQVNELLAHKLMPMTRVQLVNTAPDFVQPDGTISHLDMYDYLHLTPNGYRRVFEPLLTLLEQLLAESDETDETNNAQSLDKGQWFSFLLFLSSTFILQSPREGVNPSAFHLLYTVKRYKRPIFGRSSSFFLIWKKNQYLFF